MPAPFPFFTPAAPMHRFARMHDRVPVEMRVLEPAPLDPVSEPELGPIGPEPSYLSEMLDAAPFEGP